MRKNVFNTITAKDASQIMAQKKEGIKIERIASNTGINGDAIESFLSKSGKKKGK